MKPDHMLAVIGLRRDHRAGRHPDPRIWQDSCPLCRGALRTVESEEVVRRG